MEGLKAVLRPGTQNNHYQNFIILMMGRLVSNLGTVSFNFALSLYILDITKSAAAFTMVISFGILPGVLVNILAGVYVDRYDKKRIIVISDILSGLSVFAFSIFFKLYSTSIFIFIIYVIVLNTIQAFFNLAINASIPNFVGKEKVPKVNSAFQALGAIINITGPILGAMLYKKIGMEMILLVNAASYILSGISEAFLIYNKQRETFETVQSGSYIQNVKEVFAYLDTEKILKFLLTMAVMLNALLNPLVLLVLQYITYNVIKISGLQLSLIQSSWAMGSIVGAIFVITRKTVEPILKRFFVLLEGQAVLIILWIFPRLPYFSEVSMWTITVIYILLIFSYGMLNTIQNVPLISHYQLKIPESLRGRVFGVLYTALNISTPIGMWVFGIALQKVDWIYIPVVSGIVVLIICITQSRNSCFKEFVKKLNN